MSKSKGLDLKDTFDSSKKIDSISTKRNVDSKILKAYINVYNFLQTKVSDESVIPKLSNSILIDNWISNRNWLMIPPKDCFSREEALVSPYPNIWFYISEDLEKMESGLHWAQINSVDNFLNLLEPLNYRSVEKLKEAFKQLDKEYVIITQSKTHKKGIAPAAPADFEEVDKWYLHNFNDNIAKEILKSARKIREEGQRLREDGKVEWSVPTIQIEYKELSGDEYETLLEIISDYIKIIKVCHETLTHSQMKKIKRNLEKEFDYERIKKQYEQLKFLLKMKNITEEHFNKKVNELNEKIEQYNLTFNKNLELFREYK